MNCSFVLFDVVSRGKSVSIAAVISSNGLPSNPSFPFLTVLVDKISASGPSSCFIIFRPEAMSID